MAENSFLALGLSFPICVVKTLDQFWGGFHSALERGLSGHSKVERRDLQLSAEPLFFPYVLAWSPREILFGGE